MEKNYFKTSPFLKIKTALSILAVSAFSLNVMAQECAIPAVGCPNTDLTNSGFNADDNRVTLEYDNKVSTFHSTAVLTSPGVFRVWGENMAPNGTAAQTSPLEINSTNFTALGSAIPLKLSLGSQYVNTVQGILLATDGLYAWGVRGAVLSTSLTTSNAFQKLNFGFNNTGLPNGVNPGDVKMMFVTGQTIAITTCSGNVYVLSQNALLRGNGSTGNATTWSLVTTSTGSTLSDVVATRGSFGTLIALTRSGQVYVWGDSVFLGNNTAAENQNRATLMTLPTGIDIKMIGATTNRISSSVSDKSFYVLAVNGNLYSLGKNSSRQLGDFSTTERLSWVQPRYSTTTTNVMNNIKWFSPQEHDTYYGAVNVITNAKRLYAFGNNDTGMLGFPTSTTSVNPTTPQGIATTDEIIFVETGGHTTMVVKTCTANFGYAGHRIRGSMGNGGDQSDTQSTFTYATANIQVCGSESLPIITVEDPEINAGYSDYCVFSTLNLQPSPIGGNLTIRSGSSVASLSGNILTFNQPGTVTVRYTLPTACGGTSFVDRVFTVNNCTADLSLTKTVDVTTPVVGSNVVFTLTASNAGRSIAKNATVTDRLPSGFEFVSASPAANYNSGTGVWTLVGDFLPNTTRTLTITARIRNSGNFLNVATINSNQTNPNTANNTARAEVFPRVSAVCESNILVNPSFETPVQSTPNANNLFDSPYSGWATQNGAQINIIRVNGSNYSSGPVTAHGTGNQYLDIAGASDYPTQTFVLTSAASFSFSAWFASRDSFNTEGYANWTARVDILDVNNNIVASSSAIDFTSDTPKENWYFVSGNAPFLPAGTYKFRGFIGDFGHMDDAFLCIAPGIDAVNDDFSASVVPGTGGTLPSVFTNDTNYGSTENVSSSTVSVSLVNPPTGVSINANGVISIPAGYAPGSHTLQYTVCENAPNNANCDTATVTFVVETLATVNGSVLNDNNGTTDGVNGNGVSGATVTLFASNGTTVFATTTTNASGNYTFTQVPAGNYVVAVTTPTGFAHVSSTDASPTDGRTNVTVTGTTNQTGVNFGINQPPVALDDSVSTNAGTNAVVNVLTNDTDPNNGILSAANISLIAPPSATNTTTDANGNVTGFEIPNEGIWSLNQTTGEVTFTPNLDLTTAPTAILYTVRDAAGLLSNQAQISVTYTAASHDLTVTKTANTNTPNVGDSVTFTISVTNNGLSNATNVSVTDNLPSGYTFGSANPSAGTWSAPNWTIPTLANGATATMTITATINATGNYANTATIVADGNDPTPANNSSTVTPVPNPVSNLAITKTVNNTTPFVGSDVTFTITATNNGPSTATNIIVEENLPSGYTLVSATPSAGTWSNPNWTISSLANATSATLTVVATVNATGNYENTVSIDADEIDPTPGNNSASANITPVNVITAVADSNPTPINGLDGGDAGINIFDNDTLNGIAVNPSDVTLTSTPNGPLTVNPDGTVSVSPNTPEGTYTVDYTICEVLNPTNCSTATVTIEVIPAEILAVADTNPTPINGLDGGDAGINIFDNDTLNGIAVNPSDVTLTSTPNGPLTVNLDGTVSVNPNTAEGTYTVDYTICEILNPTNCSTATVTIEVIPAEILAVADSNPTPINGLDGGDAGINIFDNDTLNGIAVNPSDVTLTSTPNGPLTVNPDGTVSVSPNTPEGTYTVDYTICEILNPTNCSTATVTIEVIPAEILAVADTNPTPINGLDGGDAGINIFDNDTLNGIAVNPADVILT